MPKIMVAGKIEDLDTFTRTMEELETASKTEVADKPSILSDAGARAVMDAYNAKATAKPKRNRKSN